MGSLKDRAAEARAAAGYQTIPPFARAIGVKPAAVYQIESGKTLSLKAETLAAYARESGFNPDWIRTGRGPKKSTFTTLAESASFSTLPTSRSAAPSQSVQLDILTMAIQEVESVLEAADLELLVQKRAAVIASTYALLEQGLPNATVHQFIRAAVS